MKIVWGRKSIPPSLLWVCAEFSTEILLWWNISPSHLVADTATHILLNTFEFDSPKVANRVNRSREAIVHLLWKYWSHVLVEKVSHCADDHTEHLRIIWQNIYEHTNDHDISMMTLPIVMCLLAEQAYKFYSSNKLSWK